MLERRILGRDLLFERPQVRAGGQPDLGEHVDRDLVGAQRLGLPPRAAQGEHEETLQPLPERMVDDEPLELADGEQMSAELQLRRPPLLDRHQAQFFESLRLEEQRLEVVELVQRGPRHSSNERASEETAVSGDASTPSAPTPASVSNRALSISSGSTLNR